MALLSVKLYDQDDSVLLSTVRHTEEPGVSDFLPFFRALTAKGHTHQILIDQDHLIAFQSLGAKLLVATATSNMPIHKIRQFLAFLTGTLSKIPPHQRYNQTAEFEQLCHTVISSVEATPRVTIALTGLAQSGKSTFTRYFANGQPLPEFDTYLPTELLDIANVEEIKGFPFSLRFLDLGSSFQPFWYLFQPISDAFIFFVDCSKRAQLYKAQECFLELRSFWDKPFCIAANKKDLSTNINLKRHIARKFQVPSGRVFETETTTGEGLLPLIEALVNSGVKTRNNRSLDRS